MKKIGLLTLSLFFLIGAIEPNPALAYMGDRTELELSQDVNQSQTLENRSRELYQLGRYQEAINLLERLAEDYADKGAQIGQALTLRNLSLAYQ